MSSFSRTAGIVFKIVLALFIVAGIGQHLVLARTGLDVLNTFFFFTIQSNLVLLGVVAYGVVRSLTGRAEGRLGAFLRHGSTIWILITGLVYLFMLSGAAVASGRFNFSHAALHYVSPVMALLNWFLFEDKARARFPWVVWWLAYPLAYVGVSLFRLAVDGFYPYWFLNPFKPYPAGTGSVGTMLAVIAGLLAFFSLVGLLIVVLDKAMGKQNGNPAS
jgi:hypothetical protein